MSTKEHPLDSAVIDRIRGYAEDGMPPDRIADTLGVPLADVERHTVGVLRSDPPAAAEAGRPVAEPLPEPPPARARSARSLRIEAVGRMVVEEGRYQADVAREMRIPQQKVKDALIAWYQARRIPVPDPLPGKLPLDVLQARQRARAERLATTSAPTGNPGADQGAGSAQSEPDAPADVAAEPVAPTDGSAADAVTFHDGQTWERAAEILGLRSDGPVVVKAPDPEPFPVVLRQELERMRARDGQLGDAVDVILQERAAVRAVIANLEPTLDAYGDLAEHERSAGA